MGLLDWFRRRRKKKPEAQAAPVDKEKEVLERTGKLRTEIEERVEKEPKKRKRKKESV